MKRVLQLHPHKHTGKVLHHRHTSYRALLVVLMLVGACMVFTSQIARASDLVVSATIPAPIPTGAPVFTAPPDGTTVSDPSVDFEGTCPVIDPAVVVALYDGPTLLGSGPCQADGTFAVTATIAPGTRSIVAKVVTITGDYGDTSTPLTITYAPPTPATPVPTPPSTSSPRPARPTPTPQQGTLEIIADQPLISYGRNAHAIWKGRFTGGTTPYTVTVNWGDGTAQKYTGLFEAPQTFIHQYNRQRSYIVTITLSDNAGNSLTREYSAVSFTPDAAIGVTSLPRYIYYDYSNYLYYLYTLVLLLAALLWSIEHRRIHRTTPVVEKAKNRQGGSSRR